MPAGARGTVTHHTDPREAVQGAAAVYTDVWVSMGDEDTAAARRRDLASYRVDDALLDAAAPDAFAMHDLPAHPGEEISAEDTCAARASACRIRPKSQARAEGAARDARDAVTVETSASPRPQRGDELELTIESLAFGGEGVARLGDGGYVVFVAGAIPGDRVRAVVHKRKRNYAHARTLEVLEPGPERIPPTAQHPGVPWQVIPYERRLEIKRAQVDGRCAGSSNSMATRPRDRAGMAQWPIATARLVRQPGDGAAGGELDVTCAPAGGNG